MGNTQARAAATAPSSIPTQFLAAQSGGGSTISHPPMFAAYVAHCCTHRGVIFTRFTADAFEKNVTVMAKTAREHFVNTHQRQFSRNGIFYYVLEDEVQVKRVQAHMRGIEAIAFLALPCVTTPMTALVHVLGVSVACVSMFHLQQLVPATSSSMHAAVVRTCVAKALRIKDEPSMVMYDGGDGTLVIVDASSLLPVLCMPGTATKHVQQMRPEVAVGRDCAWPPAAGGSLQFSANTARLPFSVLHDVVSNATAKKRHSSVQFLHAVLAVGSHVAVDDRVKTVGTVTSVPSLSTTVTQYPTFADSDGVTQFILSYVLPNAAEALATVADTLSGFELRGFLHMAGVGMHMLGALWPHLDAVGASRQRIAVEMIARSGKHWLNARISRPDTPVDATALELFRGIHDARFVEAQLLPIVAQRFGVLSPPIGMQHLPFRMLHDRLQELTGITVNQGVVVDIRPRVRMARVAFEVTTSDEHALSTVGVRRDDGMASAIIVAAVGHHAKVSNRLGKMIAQLRSRQLDNTILQLFVACMELTLVSIKLHTKQVQSATEPLEHSVTTFMNLCSADAHDKLFSTRHALRFVDLLTKLNKTRAATPYVHRMLRAEPFREPTAVGVVSSRLLLEEFHRVSVEFCSAAHQLEEALLVAQRWVRMCLPLFGMTQHQCAAVKMLLVCLMKCHRREEGHRVASEYLEMVERIFGPFDQRTATALSDVASLTWKKNPARGLKLYQRALDIYVRFPTGSKTAASTLYNMGLAAARINKFREALRHFARSKAIALQWNDVGTAGMCDRSHKAVVEIAATKIQRWVRDCMYGVARSQTSRTDLCSTLSWSEDADEISSTVDSVHDVEAAGAVDKFDESAEGVVA